MQLTTHTDMYTLFPASMSYATPLLDKTGGNNMACVIMRQSDKFLINISHPYPVSSCFYAIPTYLVVQVERKMKYNASTTLALYLDNKPTGAIYLSGEASYRNACVCRQTLRVDRLYICMRAAVTMTPIALTTIIRHDNLSFISACRQTYVGQSFFLLTIE